jgi:hypothetical protein
MDGYLWLPHYVYKKYGYEITFDQPNLSSDIHVEDFVTRMIIPELKMYLIIEANETKAIIKNNIKKLITAMTRKSKSSPICLNNVCVNCFVTLSLYEREQQICALCRFTKGHEPWHYDMIVGDF